MGVRQPEMEGEHGPLDAQAHGHHLAGAALVGAPEGVVGLEAAGQDNAVGAVGVLVQVHRHAGAGDTQLHHLHAAADLAAHGVGGDAVAGQNLQLALRRGAAVAAHGGHDEGGRPPGLDEVHHGPGDDVHVGDAPAAGGDGHGHARPDFGAEGLSEELTLYHRGYFPGCDMLPGKYLFRPEHAGNGHIGQQV